MKSNRRKNLRDILEWKQSKEVKDNYNKLFTDRTMIENITSTAFLSLDNVNDKEFNDMYIYTASICDILLNPNYPTFEVTKKSLELRLKRFRVLSNSFCYLKINFINQY